MTSFSQLTAVFMARRAISMIVFPIYIYNYIYIYICLWPHMRLCVVYVVKEVTSFPGLGQLMGVACKRTCTQALQTIANFRLVD